MTRETWAKAYQRLCVAFGKPVSMEQAGVYFEALSGYEDDGIGRAVSAAILHEKYFPAVADLAARCAGPATDEDDALYPQFLKWQTTFKDDPQMPDITFEMFRNYVWGQRSA
jgi:hypothetical protein